MSSIFAFVDFKSPSIQYSKNWFEVDDNTHAGTAVPGSSFEFDFNGTQVWITGTLYPLQGNPPWVATFSVDGSTPAVLTAPNAATIQNRTSLFGSSLLSSDKQHKILVQVTSATREAPFLFDQLLFAPTNASPTMTASAIMYVTSSAPQVTVTVSALPENKPAPVGAIVGGVVAGVTGLAIIGILVFFWLRRRRHGRPYYYDAANAGDMLKSEAHSVPLFDAKPYGDGSHGGSAHAEAEPMLPPSLSSHTASQSVYSQSEYSQSSYAPSHHPNAPSHNDFGAGSTTSGSTSGHAGPSYGSSIMPYQPLPSSSFTAASGSGAKPPPPRSSPNQAMSKAAEAGILSVPQETRYHADSGVRFGSERSGSASGSQAAGSSGSGLPEDVLSPSDVPPSYSER